MKTQENQPTLRSTNKPAVASTASSPLRAVSTVAESLRRSPGAEASQPAIDEVQQSLECHQVVLYRLEGDAFLLEAEAHDGSSEPASQRISRQDGMVAATNPQELRLVLEGATGEPVGLLLLQTAGSMGQERSLLLDVFVELLSNHLSRQAADSTLLRTSARLARLNDLTHRLSKHNELPALIEEATSGLRELIGIGEIAVYLIDEGAPVLAANQGSGFPFPKSIQLTMTDGTPVLGEAGAAQVMVGDAVLGDRELMVQLLRGSQGINGALLIGMDDKNLAADPEVRSGLSALASHLGIAIHNTMLIEEIRRQAIYDDLTGLAGRRHFLAELTREITRARRGGGPLSLLMVDADRFKDLNDTYGHPAGDAALVAMAKALVDGTRSIDIVGRLGGEEMGVVLPGATADLASLVAERIRSSIQALQIPWNDGTLSLTVSIGVAEWTQHMKSDDLIAEADQALYQAKNLGRDLVVTQPSVETVTAD
ncbi:MAG: hypothetical protein CL928_05540 [Deltaproteobacteria bacterium]|nr:hypothetical protein [Deltaproteobacteria bacterium]